jgi:hypothetical protein
MPWTGRWARRGLAGALWIACACDGVSEVPPAAALPSQAAPAPSHAAPTPARRSARALRVLFAGCDQAGPGPSCTLGPRRRSLTVWVDVPAPDAVRITLDGAPIEVLPEPAEQGLRWVFDVPLGARRMEVRSVAASASPPFALALETEEHAAPPLLLAIERAATRDPERARRRFERERPRWQGRDRVYVQWTAGALAWKVGDREAVREAYTQGVELGERYRQWTHASRMAYTLAFLCIEDRDFECGRAWLERERALLPFATAAHQHLRGLLAENRGDLGAALVAYRQALHDARALGAGLRPVVELAALAKAMLTMAQTGDRQGAIDAMRSGLQLSESVEARHRAGFLNTAAWSLLVSQGSPAAAIPSPYQPRELLDQARASLGDEPAGDDVWFTVRLNLAYDALERGEPVAARRWLATLSGRRLDRTNDLWQRLLLARLERLEGKLPSARSRLQAMIADAEQHEDHSLRWAARVEHARVLEQLDRVPEALAEYAAADQLLEEQLPFLGLGARERFMMGRDVGTRRRVALLAAGGQDEAALCVARLGRTRALRAIRERLARDADDTTRRAFDDYLGSRLRLDAEYDATFWEASAKVATRDRREILRAREDEERRFETLMRARGRSAPPVPACDALSRPTAGALDLHYVRREHGWVGFAMDERGVVTRRDLAELAFDDDARLGEALLTPFDAQLRAARRVRVMATAELFGVPFHALPFGAGGSLLHDQLPVVYGLDLPEAPPRSGGTGPALVLEPPSNLPRAHTEADLVVGELRERGATVEWIDGDAAAETAAPLLSARALAALPEASWLHYLGHARSDGIGGWDSELVLAADGTMAIRVADVLALPAVPTTVILSGCETGVADPQSLGGGMSLAHAFILAGAHVVVANTHEIRDEDAIALMGDLYGALEGLDGDAVPPAVREAQRRARARSSAAPPQPEAWRMVRAWVP